MDYLLIFKMPSNTDIQTVKDMVRYSETEKFTISDEDDTIVLYRPSGWQATKGIVARAKSLGWELEQKV